MQPTMKDIAERLGISQAIVSLVMNRKDNGRVSSGKREEILKLAAKMNYSPNMSAVQLRGKSSKLIGIIGNFSTVPVHSAFLWQLSHLLSAEAYHDITLNVRKHDPEEERKVLSDLVARGVDAVILAETSMEESDFSKLPMPILKVLPNIKNPDITIDLHHGAYSLVSHLLKEHGHSKIGMLAMFEVCPFRKQGYLDALADNGIEASPGWIMTIKNSGAIEENILRMVKKEKISAFFCINDFIAANLIKFLSVNGINVPNDVAVTGFDGLTLTGLTSPTITTAIQPMFKLAAETSRTIVRMIKNKELRYSGKTPLLLKPEIQIAESCGCKGLKYSVGFSEFYGFATIEADKEFNHIYIEEQRNRK